MKAEFAQAQAWYHKNISEKGGWLVLPAFLLLALCLKIPVLRLPYYWDEMIVYVRPALILIDGGLHQVLPGQHSPDLFFGHTPGFSFSLALLFKIFGEEFLVGHSYSLVLSLTLLYFTFRLAEFWVSRWAGFLAVSTLFFMPIIYAQTTMVAADLGALTFCVVSLYFLARGKPLSFLIAGSIAAMMKETSAALLVPAAFHSCFAWKNGQRRAWAYTIPALLIVAFFLLEKFSTGNFSNFPFPETISFALLPLVKRSGEYFYTYFMMSQRLITMTVLFFGAVIMLWRRGGKERHFAVICFLFLLCNIVGIALLTEINQRYFIPGYGLLAILSGIALASLPSRIPAYAVLIFLAHNWIPQYSGYSGVLVYGHESSMQYLDVIAVEKEAAQFLEANHPKSKISAVWPMDAVLMEPRYGYVKAGIPIWDRGDAPETADIVVIAANGDPRLLKKRAFLKEKNFWPQKRFSVKGKWIELWSKNAAEPVPPPAKKKKRNRAGA
jgi:hypothetical protein